MPGAGTSAVSGVQGLLRGPPDGTKSWFPSSAGDRHPGCLSLGRLQALQPRWALTQGDVTAAHEGRGLGAELVLQVGGPPVSVTPWQSGYWRQPAASRGGCLGETPWKHTRGAQESRPAAAGSRQDGRSGPWPSPGRGLPRSWLSPPEFRVHVWSCTVGPQLLASLWVLDAELVLAWPC